MKKNNVLTANIFNIVVSLIATACGICIIAYKPTFLIIVAAAAIIYGVLQVIKFFRTINDSKSLVELIVGVFLILTGIFMVASPEMATKAFLFIELAVGVCGLVTGIIWLAQTFREKHITPNVLSITKLCFSAAILISGAILILFSYLGGEIFKINDRVLVGVILVLYGVNSLLWLFAKAATNPPVNETIVEPSIVSNPALNAQTINSATTPQKETVDASDQ